MGGRYRHTNVTRTQRDGRTLYGHVMRITIRKARALYGRDAYTMRRDGMTLYGRDPCTSRRGGGHYTGVTGQEDDIRTWRGHNVMPTAADLRCRSQPPSTYRRPAAVTALQCCMRSEQSGPVSLHAPLAGLQHSVVLVAAVRPGSDGQLTSPPEPQRHRRVTHTTDVVAYAPNFGDFFQWYLLFFICKYCDIKSK